MKIINILLITLLIIFSFSIAEGATFNINTAKLNWTWAPDSTGTMADGFIAKCGVNTGIYTRTFQYNVPSLRSAPVKDFINSNAVWFCVVTAYDMLGTDMLESAPSTEISAPFGRAPAQATGANFSSQ